MKALFSSLFISVALISVSSISFAAPTTRIVSVKINNPKVGGYALDLCKQWGVQCGLPAAAAYCKSKGYLSAASYKVRKNTPPTKVIRGGGLCVENYCDRISQVTCKKRIKVRPRPQFKIYKSPKIKGYALDICREWGKNCGKPAADAFCKSKGHKRSLSYKVRKNTPPTKIIRGGGICVENYCDRISKVICKR